MNDIFVQNIISMKTPHEWPEVSPRKWNEVNQFNTTLLHSGFHISRDAFGVLMIKTSFKLRFYSRTSVVQRMIKPTI